MKAPFPLLFQSARIGSMELKNRIVMPPMVTNYASEEGFVTERLKDYYAARARGGVGLVIVEATCVERRFGKGLKRQLCIDGDPCIPGLKELAEAVKAEGARIAIQLHHAGSEASSSITGNQPVGPSPLARPNREMPRELTQEDIGDLVRSFATAAKRAQTAGFDGVEIHGAHGYLIAQFLSSYFNRRSDPYGNGLEGRARFLVEILRKTRELVGPRYPLWFRMNGREFGREAGVSEEEAQRIAQMAQDEGSDAVHVSVFAYGVSPRTAPPMAQPPGFLVRFAEAIKRKVRIPVIAVGRIDPPTAEEVIGEGRADLVAIGRALIADPDLPNKAASGRLEEIRPCISCQTCLDSITSWHEALRCAVNPTVGRERESEIQRTERPKRVWVIGGGPAGMEAARVCAQRGHEVILCEKEGRLGGQLLLASIPPGKRILESLVEYQRTQLSLHGVRVELEREAKAAAVLEAGPDAVLLATGVRPQVPQIPGIDRPHVVTSEGVLSGRVEVGQKVAVIGAELVGCETAEFLAEKGRTVTLLRRNEEVATKVNPTAREHLLARLPAKGIQILTGVQYEEITEKGIVILTREGERRTIEADSIVLAAGSLPETELYEALKGKVPVLHRMGDCAEPRNLLSAMADGYFTALSV